MLTVDVHRRISNLHLTLEATLLVYSNICGLFVCVESFMGVETGLHFITAEILQAG